MISSNDQEDTENSLELTGTWKDTFESMWHLRMVWKYSHNDTAAAMN